MQKIRRRLFLDLSLLFFIFLYSLGFRMQAEAATYKGHRVVSIHVTEAFTSYMLLDDKSLYMWGDNYYGQIGIKSKDARAIAEASGFNMDIIKEKYTMAVKQNVDNIVGWLIAAIKNDYKDVQSGKNGRSSSGFNGFEQRSYDYEELEKGVLNNID